MIMRKQKTEVYALRQHICMSAHKVRRVIDQIRGRSYVATLMTLELMPYRACYPILKVVYSAGANARYSLDSNEADSFIIKAQVNEGTTVKKLKPRARGRSYLIKRPTCHITIVLKDISLKEYVYENFLYGSENGKNIDYPKSRRLRKYGWIFKKKI